MIALLILSFISRQMKPGFISVVI